jgi:hypothetical protein
MSDTRSTALPQKPSVSRFILIGVLCIASSLLNSLSCTLIQDFAKLPLYMDTLFTIAMCFTAGLVPGLITGVLLTPLAYRFMHHVPMDVPIAVFLTQDIFTVCTTIEVLLVCFFRSRMKERHAAFLKEPSLHSFTGVAAHLVTLVAASCLAVSISGGIIDFTLTQFSISNVLWPESTFKFGLLRNNVPLLATDILSRIPINIVDRFIAVFGGYGVSLLYRKLLPKAD